MEWQIFARDFDLVLECPVCLRGRALAWMVEAVGAFENAGLLKKINK